MKQRIIFGGAFDPIHNGHLAICRTAYQTLHPDEVCLMPTAETARKKLHATAETRLHLCRLAAKPYPWLRVSELEITHNLHYTADTLKILRETDKYSRLLLLLGEDQLSALPFWARWQEILQQADILAVHRPGSDADAAQQAQTRICGAGGRIRWLKCAPSDISSTQVRSTLKTDWEGAGKFLPPEVYRAIQTSDHVQSAYRVFHINEQNSAI